MSHFHLSYDFISISFSSILPLNSDLDRISNSHEDEKLREEDYKNKKERFPLSMIDVLKHRGVLRSSFKVLLIGYVLTNFEVLCQFGERSHLLNPHLNSQFNGNRWKSMTIVCLRYLSMNSPSTIFLTILVSCRIWSIISVSFAHPL